MREDNQARIVVTKNGPYVVSGEVPLAVQTIIADADGASSEWAQGETFEAKVTYALCRCGKSNMAPYCDGTHAKIGFDGTEMASREAYDAQKTTYEGPHLTLEDVRAFCAVARFCDAQRSTWDSIGETADSEAEKRVRHQAAHCPSGRLVLRDKTTGQTIEPKLPLSIGVVDDPAEKCSGPLWVRGGVAIQSQDGAAYEVRNRVTLCRCGQSKNKPFCDGSHVEVKYQDGRAKP